MCLVKSFGVTYMVMNSHEDSQGGLRTTLKGSMYQELPSKQVTQIEKVPPHPAAQMI